MRNSVIYRGGYAYFYCGNRLDGWVDLEIRQLERTALNRETSTSHSLG
jgi:hypothetical protein